MRQLKIMVIGAHPDDPENMAGSAIQYAKLGHEVMFLCATNGQSGHQEYPGHKIVRIRREEMERARKVAGIARYECLPINDGYLTTDIPCREHMMHAIRSFAPDLIFTHRPYDYHPDHRGCGQLVQDCSYLIMVPNVLPTTPVPDKMPVIFYMSDRFRKPLPFAPDVVLDVDAVFEQKLLMYAQHESQMFDWLPWVAATDPKTIPQDEAGRLEWLRGDVARRWAWQADEYRELLIKKYGPERGSRVRYCEALEACEYGGKHDPALYDTYFPF